MKKALFLLAILNLFITCSYAQVALGQWRDELSYKQGIAVAEGPTKVYVGTENSIFDYSKTDNAVHRISKQNGLADVGVSTIGLNPYNNILVVGYKNGNIDVLDKNVFYNIADVKRSSITGNKSINAIYFNGQYAYLACGFGIIYFDTERREVKDTYFIGYNGGRININDITISNNIIYAASDSGVYSASLNSPNLADFSSWSRITSLPRAIFNTICTANGNVYANLARFLETPIQVNKDTMYYFNGSAWNYFPPDTTGFQVWKLTENNGRLAVCYSGVYKVFDAGYAIVSQAGPFQTGFAIDPRAAVINAQDEVWTADHNWGMIKYSCQGWCNQRLVPDGPEKSKVYALDIQQGHIWVAPGERNGLWDGQYNYDGVFYFANDHWGVYNGTNTPALLPLRDVVSVTIDPNDPDHVYAGSLGLGLLEFNSSGYVGKYDNTNSTLQVRSDNPSSGWVGVFGEAFDSNGNLWVTNSKATNPVSVKKTDGTWQAFNFGTSISGITLGTIIVAKDNTKWVVLPRGEGILVFNENGTWATNDDNYRKLGFIVGQGGLPGTDVYCIAEDQSQEIWVGTDKGIAVFYSPDNIFSSNPSDAQQILIEQDGHTQILLETEEVTAIAVDGANRKWIGTQNAGVFLMSADGTQQIYHFDESNSPLLSNSITGIKINGETGEVYFGTAKGMISYRSTATEGKDDFENVYAYPNPVKPGYSGPIAIKGLVKDCDVKITDINGTLIYQTKALGGQAIWDGKNFNGDRAHSGVYLVFCSNDDGSKTFVTKICIVN
ncbi:MAG TPA: two-component regulator propeller domain-containing protein [Bacteroidia bacterium]|jgi:ligand-binding sensor domain-containing protein